MHFSKTVFLQALLAGSGLASQEKRQVGIAQNSLANIQLAELSLQNSLRNLNLNIPQTAQIIPNQIAAIENAMNLGLLQLQNTGILSNAEAQLLLASANSLGSAVQLATMGFILQQPTLDQFGLIPASLQTLQNQRALVNQLGQIALTRVPTDTVGLFQTGFGQTLSSLDFGLAQLQGQGVVGVQLSQAGQIPVQGLNVLSQECASIGFAPINSIVGVNGIGINNQQALLQQCASVGFVPFQQVQVLQQALGQQQLINQCAALGFLPTNLVQGQFIQQDLANQCVALGFLPFNQVQGQVNQADVLNQCAQLGFVQPSGVAMNGEQIVSELVASQMVSGASVDVSAGVNLQGQDQLVQQCLSIGFVQANQAQQQFVASPEQCAAFGLVQQNNDNNNNNNNNNDNNNNNNNNEQGVVEQCAALGFQPSDAVNQEAVAQLEQQLGINQAQNVAVEAQGAVAEVAEEEQVAAEEQVAEEEQAAEEAKVKRQATEASAVESAAESAAEPAVESAAESAVESAVESAAEAAAATTASVEIAEATQAQQGAVSAEQCAQLGFVQVNAAAATAATATEVANATATEVAARMVRRRRTAMFRA